jgi:phytoene/squalene synthetase
MTNTAKQEAVAKAIAKALNPGLFSEDDFLRHEAASPKSVEAAQEHALLQANIAAAAALSAIEPELREMREALEFYADRENYVDGPSVSKTVYAPYYPVLDDKGQRAQKAIGVSDEN